MARADADPAIVRSAANILDHQRRHNLERIDWMIHHHAKPRRWPGDLAQDYLKSHIAYEFTDARRAGLELFFEKAHAHGLIEECKALNIDAGAA